MSHDYDVWVTYKVAIRDVADADDARSEAVELIGSRITPEDVEVEEVNKP